MPLSIPNSAAITPAASTSLGTVNTKDAVTTFTNAALDGFSNAIILAEYVNNAAASATNQPVVNIGKTGALVLGTGITLNFKNPDAAVAWITCDSLIFFVPLVKTGGHNGFDYFITGTYAVGDSFKLYLQGSF